MSVIKLLFMSVLCILTACTTMSNEPAIKIKTIEVKVPVPVACKTPVPVPPTFCFTNLRENDNIFVKTACLLSDRKKSMAYELELLATIESCK